MPISLLRRFAGGGERGVRGKPPTERWGVVSGRSDEGVTEREGASVDADQARPLRRFEVLGGGMKRPSRCEDPDHIAGVVGRRYSSRLWVVSGRRSI